MPEVFVKELKAIIGMMVKYSGEELVVTRITLDDSVEGLVESEPLGVLLVGRCFLEELEGTISLLKEPIAMGNDPLVKEELVGTPFPPFELTASRL